MAFLLHEAVSGHEGPGVLHARALVRGGGHFLGLLGVPGDAEPKAETLADLEGHEKAEDQLEMVDGIHEVHLQSSYQSGLV